jgi:hypothetical protein
MEMTTQMSTIETKQCFQCGKTGKLQIPSPDYFAGIKKLEQGALIQHAFPNLNAEQREQIMTGIHPECWKKMFPPGEED